MRSLSQSLLLHRLRASVHCNVWDSNSFLKSGFMLIQIMHKTTGGKPKHRVYHRVHELDKVMDLQKKPTQILKMKSIIESRKNQTLLLRDIEKEVGIVKKWNFIRAIEKYPSIFYVRGGHKVPPEVTLSTKAKQIAAEEAQANELMEPILVKNLRKLLMLSVDCRLPLETVDFIQPELGLPADFKESFIPKFPEYFSVKDIRGRPYLELGNWDSSLAVTAREEKYRQFRISVHEENYRHSRTLDTSGDAKPVGISKDGNFFGRYAFHMKLPVGFRPNVKYLRKLEKWQKLSFPSPYLNAKRFVVSDPQARKRVVAVLHELLSLTMEKRLCSGQLYAFRPELRLPKNLLLCMIKHHGVFYITNKGIKSTVFLKEAYDGSRLVDKCPILAFRDKFVALTNRRKDIEPTSSTM